MSKIKIYILLGENYRVIANVGPYYENYNAYPPEGKRAHRSLPTTPIVITTVTPSGLLSTLKQKTALHYDNVRNTTKNPFIALAQTENESIVVTTESSVSRSNSIETNKSATIKSITTEGASSSIEDIPKKLTTVNPVTTSQSKLPTTANAVNESPSQSVHHTHQLMTSSASELTTTENVINELFSENAVNESPSPSVQHQIKTSSTSVSRTTESEIDELFYYFDDEVKTEFKKLGHDKNKLNPGNLRKFLQYYDETAMFIYAGLFIGHQTIMKDDELKAYQTLYELLKFRETNKPIHVDVEENEIKVKPAFDDLFDN